MTYPRLIGLLLLLFSVTLSAEELGGDFTLAAHTGDSFSLSDARGKISLLFFGYTHCPDVCPDTLARIRILLNKVDPEAQHIQPLFVSVDPERDTPETLAEYVKYFHPSVIGLTGSKEQIDAVIKQYRAHYRLLGKEAGYTVDHTAHLFLIDQQGKLARIIPYGLPIDELIDAVSSLLESEEQEEAES